MVQSTGNGAAAPAINGQAYPIVDHTYDVTVVGGEPIGVGEGTSKKAAQQEAARAALIRITAG